MELAQALLLLVVTCTVPRPARTEAQSTLAAHSLTPARLFVNETAPLDTTLPAGAVFNSRGAQLAASRRFATAVLRAKALRVVLLWPIA